MTKFEKSPTRGLRNCNPLNIVINKNNRWLGRIDPSRNTDGKFEQFVAIEWGLRAAIIILTKYMLIYKLRRVADIVHKWAPDGGAIETNYIMYVLKAVGKTAIVSKEDFLKLVKAMAMFESGFKIKDKLMESAWVHLPINTAIFWMDKERENNSGKTKS